MAKRQEKAHKEKAQKPERSFSLGEIWVLATFLMAGLAVSAIVLFSIESGRNAQIVSTANKMATDQKRRLATIEKRLTAYEELGKIEASAEAKMTELASLDREIQGVRSRLETAMAEAKRAKGKKKDQAIAQLKADFGAQLTQLDARRTASQTELSRLREQGQSLRTAMLSAPRAEPKKGPPPPVTKPNEGDAPAPQPAEEQGEE